MQPRGTTDRQAVMNSIADGVEYRISRVKSESVTLESIVRDMKPFDSDDPDDGVSSTELMRQLNSPPNGDFKVVTELPQRGDVAMREAPPRANFSSARGRSVEQTVIDVTKEKAWCDAHGLSQPCPRVVVTEQPIDLVYGVASAKASSP